MRAPHGRTYGVALSFAVSSSAGREVDYEVLGLGVESLLGSHVAGKDDRVDQTPSFASCSLVQRYGAK